MSTQSVGTASFVWSRKPTVVMSISVVSNYSPWKLTCEDELCYRHTETRQESVEGLKEYQYPQACAGVL